MLYQFSVQNYKSIKDEAVLSMQALDLNQHKESLLHGKDSENYLPIAVIYGPNGGGKSNTLKALCTLRANLLLRPIKRPTKSAWDQANIFDYLEIDPFAFDIKSKTGEETIFDIIYESNNILFHYNISYKNDKILQEKLTYQDKEEEVIFFDRKKDIFFQSPGIENISTEFLSDDLPYLTFLSVFASKNPIVNAAFEWFSEYICVLDLSKPRNESFVKVPIEPEIKSIFLKRMKEMDLEISDYTIKEEDGVIEEVVFTHTVGGKNFPLDFTKESAGTQKIFLMLSDIIYCIEKGALLIVDELDAKLHPLLLLYIIQLFRDSKINTHGAQLLFTSHDLTSMDENFLRRDEIWFAAKDAGKSTRLYSLADFREDPSNPETISNKYLAGCYGADPYLKKLITWSDEL